jgi:hypothetical protein
MKHNKEVTPNSIDNCSCGNEIEVSKGSKIKFQKYFTDKELNSKVSLRYT